MGDAGSDNVPHFRYTEFEVLFKKPRVPQLHLWTYGVSLNEKLG